MPSRSAEITAEQRKMVRWIAGVGAVGADALACHLGVSVASARARLNVAQRKGWLSRSRLLVDRPALYTATRCGLRACDAAALEPVRVGPASATHLLACAEVAAALQRCYPDHRVLGERELRVAERQRGRPLASVVLGAGPHGEQLLHRCDLALLPAATSTLQPVAVEVELTLKAPARLASICRAWARARHVAGVLYIAPPEIERALTRAVERAHAQEHVVIVGPRELGLTGRIGWVPAPSTVPSVA